jgi:O-antigen ligase
VFATVVYFTFSRGSWIALALGLLATLALSPARIRLTIAALAIGAPAALAVLLASRSDALTHQGAALSAAVDEGRRLAVWIVVLVVVAAALGALAARPVVIAARAERVYAWTLAAALVVALVVVMLAAGGPIRAVERTWDSFAAAPGKTQPDLRKRLFSFSSNGRVDLWSAALDQFAAHPVVGAGGGAYEEYWLQHRDAAMKVRDAHSLYLENLAELGVVGLALLVVALGTPLVAGIRRRNLATGAYVAFLAHAGIDWDWEITSVTLAGLLVGVALLAAARDHEEPTTTRVRRGTLAAALVVAALGFVFLVGNMFLSRANAAADRADWKHAASHAARAHTWLPWSTAPLRLRGEALLAQGRTADARASFRDALDKDPADWTLWLDLARAGDRSALAQAKRLNPLSPELQEFANEGGIDIGVGG